MGNWDVELEPNKNLVKTELDAISREAVKELYFKDGYIDFHKICELQPEPSEITDEQAILHLQSTGWMQNHDREMYESGLREKLADDSGSYDSLIPYEDTVSLGVFEQVMWERDVAIDQLKELGYGFGEKIRTDDDSISRQAAIDAVEFGISYVTLYNTETGEVKTMCEENNEALKKAAKRIAELPPVTPKQRTEWIPVSEPPKKLGTYLIQTDGEYMCECRWTDVNPYWTDKKTKPHWNIFDIPQYSKVVAWMPLPAPYKAESEVSDADSD